MYYRIVYLKPNNFINQRNPSKFNKNIFKKQTHKKEFAWIEKIKSTIYNLKFHVIFSQQLHFISSISILPLSLWRMEVKHFEHLSEEAIEFVWDSRFV